MSALCIFVFIVNKQKKYHILLSCVILSAAELIVHLPRLAVKLEYTADDMTWTASKAL